MGKAHCFGTLIRHCTARSVRYSGDFTWTVGAAFKRRTTGCVGDSWKSALL